MRPSPAALVVLAGVAAALHVGKLPPALPALQLELGLSLLQAAFLLSAVQLAGMALGLAGGALADAWGARRSLLAGLTTLALASAIGGFVTDATGLLVLRGIEGLGFMLAVLPAPGLVRQLAQPGSESTWLGLWGAYMPLATALALLLGPGCVAAFGWPAWWWSLAAGTPSPPLPSGGACPRRPASPRQSPPPVARCSGLPTGSGAPWRHRGRGRWRWPSAATRRSGWP
jgi:MFS family permease